MRREVTSAMLNVTLPSFAADKEILAQTIGGVKAALEEQGAILVGVTRWNQGQNQ